MIVAAGLILLAGCSTDQNDRGGAASTTVGISGGATGVSSGTSQDPLGSGGGGAEATRKAPTDRSTTQP